jgi:hypothetical protein
VSRRTTEKRRGGAALPGEPGAGATTPARREPVPPALQDEVGHVVAVMGGSGRKGRWEPPALLRVLAVMGGVELDFREADLLEGTTEVEVVAFMGGVQIVVPPDVDVQANGVGLLGGFTSVSGQSPEADAPRIEIRGWAVLGGVDVKVKPLEREMRLLPE